MKRVLAMFVGVLALMSANGAQISLSGKVVDTSGVAVSGATVKMAIAGIATTTNAQGAYTLTGATSVVRAGHLVTPFESDRAAASSVSLYNFKGECIGKTNCATIANSNAFSFNSVSIRSASQLYLMKVVQGNESQVKRLLTLGVAGDHTEVVSRSATEALGKVLASLDTLQISKNGFITRSIAISSYTGTRSADTLYRMQQFNLGAVDQWQNITPPGVSLGDNGVVSILADTLHSGTIYTAIYAQGIYKSTDYGTTWKRVNTGRNGDVLQTGGQWIMQIDPVEPQVLYATNYYGSNWNLFKTTNGGVDWDPVFQPGSEAVQSIPNFFVQALAIDPADHLHLLVTFHNDCTSGNHLGMCMADSRDGGTTWRMFKGPTGGWVEGASPFIVSSTAMLYGTNLDGLFYSGDNGNSWAKVGGGGGHQIYRATNGVLYIGYQYGMLRSTNNGVTWAPTNPNGGGVQGDGLIGDGKRIFTGRPFSTATESLGNDWKSYATAPGDNIMGYNRCVYMAYDPVLHLLYADCTAAGLWRVRTQ